MCGSAVCLFGWLCVFKFQIYRLLGHANKHRSRGNIQKVTFGSFAFAFAFAFAWRVLVCCGVLCFLFLECINDPAARHSVTLVTLVTTYPRNDLAVYASSGS